MGDTGFEPVATTVSRQCSTTELIAQIEEIFFIPLIRKQQVAFHFLSNLTFHRSLLVISKFRISINIIGIFLHFASDAQKYFTLRIKKELIKDGFFKNIRNTNYLGEILIYLSFAILSMSYIPFVILALFFFVVFLPRMIKKDKSLTKYPAFKEYKQISGLLFPKI